MSVFNLSQTTGPSGVAANTLPLSRKAAQLQESLHQSHRAMFTKEYGEARGLHRIATHSQAVDLDAAAFESEADFVSPPANSAFAAAYLGHPFESLEAHPARAANSENAYPARSERPALSRDTETQLRGLVQDFRERQEQANHIVTGSIATAFILTLAGCALLLVAAG